MAEWHRLWSGLGRMGVARGGLGGSKWTCPFTLHYVHCTGPWHSALSAPLVAVTVPTSRLLRGTGPLSCR